MAEKSFRVYPYRWVVLAMFMFVNLTIQILWITYASITGPAATYYGVTDLQIGLLSMTFMLVFIPLSIPVSWVIDTYGFRLAASIGAILMGIFAVTRGLAGNHYDLVLWSTIGIAIAQPSLLNTWTKMPANWFSTDQRATAVGLITLSSLIGTGIGLGLTPVLIEQISIPQVQLIYGGVAAFSAVLFLLFAREKPPTPPCPPEMEARALMLDGLKHALTVRPFLYYLVVSFIGLGLFNGITTWVENIIRPRGFSPTEAGTLGALMLLGGLLGAVLIPPISDRQQKRQRFLFLGIGLAIPGLLGVTYAHNIWLLLVSAFFFGFFLVSANPIGMQYAAEVSYPTPEGTSNGLIQLFGQASVVFVYVMEMLKTPDGSFTHSLWLAAGLLGLSLLLITQMKDPHELGIGKSARDLSAAAGNKGGTGQTKP